MHSRNVVPLTTGVISTGVVSDAWLSATHCSSFTPPQVSSHGIHDGIRAMGREPLHLSRYHVSPGQRRMVQHLLQGNPRHVVDQHPHRSRVAPQRAGAGRVSGWLRRHRRDLEACHKTIDFPIGSRTSVMREPPGTRASNPLMMRQLDSLDCRASRHTR